MSPDLENKDSTRKGWIADLGGTNVRFATVSEAGIHDERKLKCADYKNFKTAIKTYLDGINTPDKLDRAAICVAGPVDGDEFTMTNNPWEFRFSDIKQEFGLETLYVRNDLAAIARGVKHLRADDFRCIHASMNKPVDTIAIVGCGTGLGMAGFVPNTSGEDRAPEVIAGEGGHVTFPVMNKREFDILEILQKRYHHVSAERVCSGKGLRNIYESLLHIERIDRPDATPEEIVAMARVKKDPVAEEALSIMIDILGRVASNLAITLGSGGGVYICGGLGVELMKDTVRDRFLVSFMNKGRFRSYLERIPVYVIEHPTPAFHGLRADVLRNMRMGDQALQAF